MRKKLVLTVWIILFTLTLAACAAPPPVTTLSPEAGAAYAAEVDEYVESYLVGPSKCDYAMHTRGLDPKVWEGHLQSESAFLQGCKAELAVRGAYQSKTLDTVEDQGGLRCVIYRVVFEKDPENTLRVCFLIDDPDHLIVGTKME
jgi:hypothetical protein